MNFRMYFISIKPTRNSRDKQFSSMASRGRPLRKRIYLSLRPQLQLLNGNVHRAGKCAADSRIVRCYFSWWSRAPTELTLENCKSIIALQPVIQIYELPRNLIVMMPLRDSLTRRDFILWLFFLIVNLLRLLMIMLIAANQFGKEEPSEEKYVLPFFFRISYHVRKKVSDFAIYGCRRITRLISWKRKIVQLKVNTQNKF